MVSIACFLIVQRNVCYGYSLEAYHGHPEGGHRVRTRSPPLKNHQNIGFLCNTCPHPLKNYKPTKPVFDIGPASAHQQNGPFIALFGSSFPPSTKKKHYQNRTPLTKLYGIGAGISLWHFYWAPQQMLIAENKENIAHLNQNICCPYSKEPSKWGFSFESTKQLLELMDMKKLSWG